jgi:Domain of unknown function (DUF4262)
MNASEKKILHDIEKYGCHVTSVVDPSGESPTFSYSIGIQKTCKAPEVIVVGLNPNLGHEIVNDYRDRVRKGEVFSQGSQYSGFLKHFDVYIEPVDQAHREEYMLSDVWLYGGSAFEAVQIIYPTTSGVWPWEPSATDWFKSHQPLLGRCPV